MTIECKTYKFSEFCKLLNITKNQRERRLNELLDWLKEFYDYTFIKGSPGTSYLIIIHNIYGDYTPLPRKNLNQSQQKHQDVQDFILTEYLSTEWRYASKADAARNYIIKEGYDKYHWTNNQYVATTYVKPVFDAHAESDGNRVWAWYSSYTPLPEKILEDWRKIREKEQIDDKKAANAFYKLSQGEDIQQELTAFQRAILNFQDKYNDTPVLIEQWKLREREIENSTNQA